MTTLELFESLERTLRDEQRAVAELNLEWLDRLTLEKTRLAAEIAKAPDAAAKALPRDMLARVSALANANALLLRSATETIRDVLGVDRPLGTYDARARMRNTSSALAVRVL